MTAKQKRAFYNYTVGCKGMEREASREALDNYGEFSKIAYSTSTFADRWDDGALEYYGGACKRLTGYRV